MLNGEPYFIDEVKTDTILKGESSVIKAIARVATAVRITGTVVGVNTVLILACGATRITDAASMRRHFGFAGGTKSGDG